MGSNELHSDRKPRQATLERQRNGGISGAVKKRREGFNWREVIEDITVGGIWRIDRMHSNLQGQAGVCWSEKHVKICEEVSDLTGYNVIVVFRGNQPSGR